MMDGTIRLESKLNQGTTFTLDFPYEHLDISTDDQTEKKTTYDYHLLSGTHILLAEDNDINTEIATTLLEKYGCLVKRAENGEEVCREFETSDVGYYNLILMDIRMPLMNGLTATKKIRSMKRKDAKKIPIIAMTADAFNEDEQVAINAGMNAHIAKPFDPVQLYDTCCSFIL